MRTLSDSKFTEGVLTQTGVRSWNEHTTIPVETKECTFKTFAITLRGALTKIKFVLETDVSYDARACV